MALTTVSGLTEYNDCDVVTGWTGVDGIDTDEKIEGTGCLASDVDIETDIMLGPTVTSINMSTTKYAIYPWIANYTAAYLDLKTNGGLFVALSDGTNSSYWYVGGTDTYPGGWEVLVANTDAAPDGNSGTAANLASITNMGFGFKGVSKSKLADNSFVDYFRYASGAALRVYGTNTTTDDGWSEILTDDQTLIAGVIKAQAGSYVVKGPIEIGDSVGTNSTTFTEDGNIIVFPDLPVGDNHYAITCIGNGTGTTSVTLANQVIKSAGGRFSFDQSDTNLTSFTMTGTTLVHANSPTFKSGQTVTGDTFDDCLQIVPSTSTFTGNIIKGYVGTGGGALLFSSANTANCSFISAGSGHAIKITATGTYTFTGHEFSGYSTTSPGSNLISSTGSTDAMVYNDSGGLVTLNVAGGGTTPTVRNGAGATTQVNSNVLVTYNTLVNGSEVRVYLAGTSTPVDGVESVTGNSFSWSVGSGVSMDIKIFGPTPTPPSPPSVAYNDIIQKAKSFTSDTSVDITQTINRNYYDGT